MIRVSETASSNLPGTLMKRRREQLHQLRAEDHAQHANQPHDNDQRGRHQVVKLARFRSSFGGEIARKDRDEGGRKRAFGEQIAREIRDTEPDQERVVNFARAKECAITRSRTRPGDAAQCDCDGNDSGRPNQLCLPSPEVRSARSASHRRRFRPFIPLLRALPLRIDLARLLERGEFHARAASRTPFPPPRPSAWTSAKRTLDSRATTARPPTARRPRR